ncbi:MAG TPA: SDR family NAD(P)-dependent oxidoreductase [Gammaproteobacteria bacterium]|nr:SDR family NAD(P)-dependent oxidoreductase [Gammaproteobacteria bacterium]
MTELPRTPSFRLDGKRALVTGAGRGIGLAAATALAEAGARVTLVARSAAEIEAVAQALEARAYEAEAVAMDVTDTAAVEAHIAGTVPYDVLVNNAGMNRPALMQDVSEQSYDQVMTLNVRAAFFTARAVAKALMQARRPGSIINISSQMGHVGAPKRTIYCASKHAMEGWTKALAWELGEHDIRVNTLCPTFIETPMTRPMLGDDAFREQVVSRIALGRVGQVEDIMGATVFLASDASRLVTGSALLVDGGWTAV